MKCRANQAIATSNAPSENSDSESEDSNSMYMAFSATSPHSAFGWILDGGSTTHLCKDCSAFVSFQPTKSIIHSINEGGPQLEVEGTGTVNILVSVKGQADRVVTLKDVCFTPNARDNLISES